jgi:O-antigen/teichoic acid export membrane protein
MKEITMDIDIQEYYESSLKKVAGGGLLILIGSIAAKIAGFLRQLIIIRMLSPQLYGLFALGLTFFNLMPSIGLLGLYHGSQRYIAYYIAAGDDSKVKGTLRSALTIVFVTSIILPSLLAAFSGPLSSILSKPEFRNVLLVFVLGIPFAMFNSIFTSFFLGFRRADIAVFLGDLLFSALSVILIFLGLLVWKSVYSPVIAMTATTSTVFGTAFYFYTRIIRRPLREVTPARITGELLLLSLPLFFSGISYIILNNTDTLMLGYYMPSEAVGFYNGAFLLMQTMAVFLNSFSVIFMPVLAGLVAKKLQREVRELYQVVTKWIFLLTLPAILTFFFFPRQVLTTLFSAPYGQAGTALAILVAAEFMHTTLGPNEQALIAHGATRAVFAGYGTAAVLNIILNAVLIPRMGISGAAAATGISLVVLNLCFSSVLYFRFKVHPFERRLLVPLVLCLASAAGLYLPMRYLVNRSPWLAFSCYPIFLALGVAFTLVTRSYSEEDLLVWRAIKSRLSGIRS